MRRPPLIPVLAVVASVVSLAACSSEPAPAPTATLPPTAGVPAPTAPGSGAARLPGADSGSGAAKLPGAAPRQAFAVETRTLRLQRGADRPLPTTVWQPKGDGPFPLILFSHGLGGKPSDYRNLLTAWARAGFVVAAPAYPHTSASATDFNVLDVINQPADATHVITRTLAELGAAVDKSRIAAAGHSAGGVTTIGLFSGARDERLRAGVILAGRQILPQPFTGPEAPLLFVHGRRDNTVTYADGQAAYSAVQWPKAFLSVTNGGHVASGRSLDVIATTSTDFWRWTLYGDQPARDRLEPDATRGGLATLQDNLG
ncbi:alpha/beta hydrolase family protein [Paractinoplanes aksuensis]|uniref:alpha/beta hydrolase family protein n=1 Tax=Paractinoplanes aksuensis TaxID=2939490 RepID=UPI003F691B1C